MIRLFQIELIKLKSYRAFWVFTIAYIVLYFLAVGTIQSIQLEGVDVNTDNIYVFPQLWHNLTYLASYLNLLLGIFMILLVTNEFNYRTFKQNIISGLSRAEIIISKFLVAVAVAVKCVLFVFVFGLYKGLSNGKFMSIGDILETLHYLGFLGIQIVGYMALAGLFAFIIKRAAMAIVVFLAYTVILERIIRFRIPESIDKFLPVKVLDDLITLPGKEQVQTFTGLELYSLPGGAAGTLSLVYILVFTLLSYLVLRRTDL